MHESSRTALECAVKLCFISEHMQIYICLKGQCIFSFKVNEATTSFMECDASHTNFCFLVKSLKITYWRHKISEVGVISTQSIVW